MTTIVYDGEVLATDTMVSFNDIKVYQDKAMRLSKGRILAVCGEIGVMPTVAALIERSAPPKEYPKGDYGAILLCREDAYVLSEGEWSRLDAPYACGSGGMAALAGLCVGMSAKEACELACKVDLYSGGKVKTYRKPR